MKISTSEYVSLGHPDKTADYISEYIFDRYLEKDKNTRYAVEVQIKGNWVSLAGEIKSKHKFTKEERAQFVKNAIKEIGYTNEYAKIWGSENTINADCIEVTEHLSEQSDDIAIGVNNYGWGDQGIFWGMATSDEKHNYLPLDYWYAKYIWNKLYDDRIGGLDIKTQITIQDNVVTDVIVAIPSKKPQDEIYKNVKQIVDEIIMSDNYKLTVNGTGKYIMHSAIADCGTTGRKLVVDFYGGNCRIGGGSPWTKDPTKADLTLNLYARHIAKEYIKTHKQQICYVSINCCIGKDDLLICIYDEHNILLKQYNEKASPQKIIDLLKLKDISYTKLCKYGLIYG